jgi:hypothetical protein
MATLLEIRALPSNPGWGAFVGQIESACVKKAAAIITSASPGDGAKEWAKSTLAGPQSVANQIVFAVIGLVDNAFENAPVSAILGADEADITTYVSTAVDKLYGV